MISIQCKNFNLDQIANSGQCFRFFKVEDKYNIVAFGKVLEVAQDNDTIYFNCSQEDFDTIWSMYFNLHIQMDEVDHKDKFLLDAYHYGSGIRILHQDLWEIMVSFIISQRKNIPAIKNSIERLCKAYGDSIAGTPYYTFPTAAQLFNMDKDDCGLGYRLPYIKTLARTKNLGDLNIMSYNEAKKFLLSIRGIGEKVANCILLFGLNYFNACPIDVWMQKIIDEEYNGIKPDWMTSAYAGYYQQLAFYYKRKGRKIT